MRRIVLLAVVAACHHGGSRRPEPKTGAIAGVVRDRTTGEAVDAQLAAHGVTLQAHGARTAADGSYRIDGLDPGTYDLVVAVPGASVDFTGIPVTAGRTTGFDVPFDSAFEDGTSMSYSAVETDDIVRTPRESLGDRARIEGVVTDVVTRERVAGEVIVAVSDMLDEPVTVVSDDQGHYAMPDLPPGEYDLSAYYTVARRGQIEVRRNDIDIRAGTVVYVPIYVELSGTE